MYHLDSLIFDYLKLVYSIEATATNLRSFTPEVSPTVETDGAILKPGSTERPQGVGILSGD